MLSGGTEGNRDGLSQESQDRKQTDGTGKSPQFHTLCPERNPKYAPVARDRQHCLVELWDLPVDQGLQGLLEPVVVALQLPLIFLLVRPDQALVLPQGILTPATQTL